MTATIRSGDAGLRGDAAGASAELQHQVLVAFEREHDLVCLARLERQLRRRLSDEHAVNRDARARRDEDGLDLGAAAWRGAQRPGRRQAPEPARRRWERGGADGRGGSAPVQAPAPVGAGRCRGRRRGGIALGVGGLTGAGSGAGTAVAAGFGAGVTVGAGSSGRVVGTALQGRHTRKYAAAATAATPATIGNSVPPPFFDWVASRAGLPAFFGRRLRFLDGSLDRRGLGRLLGGGLARRGDCVVHGLRGRRGLLRLRPRRRAPPEQPLRSTARARPRPPGPCRGCVTRRLGGDRRFDGRRGRRRRCVGHWRVARRSHGDGRFDVRRGSGFRRRRCGLVTNRRRRGERGGFPGVRRVRRLHIAEDVVMVVRRRRGLERR